MNILVTGSQSRFEELKQILPDDAEVQYIADLSGSNPEAFDVIFDLNFDDNPGNLLYYAHLENKPVFAGAVKLQLVQAVGQFDGSIKCALIGMNTLPTFINRDKVECSLYHASAKPALDQVSGNLGWETLVVEDRVGMVTPRVVCMIINEACYTVQEGTASMQDIDQGMKLGTNYPGGPFEWADKIGVANVYDTLKALFEDTRDERYKICPLLKTQYLKNQSFYTAN